MTLTIMCDPRSENELFSLKLLKGLDLHISFDWWQHIQTYTQTQTKIHGVWGLKYQIFVSSSHTNKYGNTCRHIQIYTLSDSFTDAKKTPTYTQICTLTHMHIHIYAHYKAYIKRLSEARPALWAILDPDWTDRRSPQNPASFLLKHFLHTGWSKLVCHFYMCLSVGWLIK